MVTPRPFVAIHAGLAAALLSALSLIGHLTLAALLAGVIGIAGASLAIAYLWALRHSGRQLRSRRRRDLDRFVACLWLAAATLPLLTVAGVVVFQSEPLGGPLFVHVSLVAVAVASTGLFISSLVDWYWILPRLTGIVRPAPWESAGDPAWRRLTALWLFHRSIALLIITFALVAVPTYMASTASGHDRVAWLAAAAVLAAALVPLNENVGVALNPPVCVGDVIEFEGGAAYIIDVSLSGAKFQRIGPDGQVLPLRLDGDGVIPLREITRYPRVSQPGRLEGVTARPESAHRVWPSNVSDIGTESDTRLEQLLRDEETAMRDAQARASKELFVSALAATVGAVASIIAAITQITSVLSNRAVIAPVAVSALAAAGLVRAVVILRRRQVIEGESTPPVALSGALREASEAVERQRRALRHVLAAPAGGPND